MPKSYLGKIFRQKCLLAVEIWHNIVCIISMGDLAHSYIGSTSMLPDKHLIVYNLSFFGPGSAPEVGAHVSEGVSLDSSFLFSFMIHNITAYAISQFQWLIV